MSETNMNSEGKTMRIGMRVEVIGKGIVGAVAFVGPTQFSAGKLKTEVLICYVTDSVGHLGFDIMCI